MRAMSAVPCLFLASALGAGAADLPRIDANARVAAMVTNAVMRKDSTALAAYLSGRDSTWEWRAEFWGKHTLAAAPLAAMTGDAAFRANVAAGVERVIASQLPDGYIGSYRDRCGEGWDVWGIKYTLLGLLSWHEATGDARSLEAARRLADFLISEVGPGGRRRLVSTGNYNGLASASVLACTCLTSTPIFPLWRMPPRRRPWILSSTSPAMPWRKRTKP